MYEKIIQNLLENHNSLKHYGIKDMHWGVRRFQNPDGSLTEEGRERYGVGEPRENGFSDDFIRGVKNLHKDPSELSTKEIRDILSRLQAEDQLKNATKKNSKWRKLMEIVNQYSNDVNTIANAYGNTKKLISIPGDAKHLKDWLDMLEKNRKKMYEQ